MASALSYVSKFKSFVILFLTPILLLPLIILMPAKVSCVSGQPGGFREPGAPYGAANPGRWGHAPSGAPGAVGGALHGILRGMDVGIHRSLETRTVLAKHTDLEISTDLDHTAHP